MSRTIPRRTANFSLKIEYDSEEYKEYRDYLKTRLGSNGLSLCADHWMTFNPYWKDRHKLKNPTCCVLLPKDWIPDERFLDVVIKYQKIEGENTLLRPAEHDEPEEREIQNDDAIKPKTLMDLLKESANKKKAVTLKTIRTPTQPSPQIATAPAQSSPQITTAIDQIYEEVRTNRPPQNDPAQMDLLSLKVEKLELRLDTLDLRLKAFENIEVSRRSYIDENITGMFGELKKVEGLKDQVSSLKRRIDQITEGLEDESPLGGVPKHVKTNEQIKSNEHVKTNEEKEKGSTSATQRPMTRSNTSTSIQDKKL